jgi:parallel beta-helix repeat protein
MKNSLFKKGFVVALIFLFFGLNIIPSTGGIELNGTIIPYIRGNTLFVGGNGSGNYTTIQSAIDDANNGDTVFVYDDSSPYYENVIVDKSISLVGEDKDSTVINAKYKGTPITITADNCQVSEFSILNCQGSLNDWDFALIKIISSNHVIIQDNIIYEGHIEYNDWFAAIEIFDSTYNTIQDNYISEEELVGRSIGIVLCESSNNVISGNDISNYIRGISNAGDENSNNNIISDNHIHLNLRGIFFVYNSYNEILNNTIEYNFGKGVDIRDSHHNTIKGNVISNNGDNGEFDCGIMLVSDESSDNIVSDNIISYNKPCGIQIIYSYDNVITRNNFIDNYGEEGTPERWWGNAYFCNPSYTWRFFNMNSWKRNYWSDLSSNIKIIKGSIEFYIIYPILLINWINIEWNPAKEPYNI